MPYIDQAARDRIADGSRPNTPGELNYCLTLLLHDYVDRAGANYFAFNDAIGALEAAKLEMYRRLVVPYEDEKIRINGDVLGLDL